MIAFGVDAEVPLWVDREIISSPAFEAVVIFGVFNGPRRLFAHVCRSVTFNPQAESARGNHHESDAFRLDPLGDLP